MEYEKENLIYDINDTEKDIQLIQSILKTQHDLDKAHNNFDFAEDELIDFYAYQIKALNSKLDYLTRLAKIKKISINLVDKKAV